MQQQKRTVWIVGRYETFSFLPGVRWLAEVLAWFDNQTAAEVFLAGYRYGWHSATERTSVNAQCTSVDVKEVEWDFFEQWMKENQGMTMIPDSAY